MNKILGIRIDEVDLNSAIERVRNFLFSDEQHAIFTPNPEMVVKGKKDNFFVEAINKSSLNICDGFGLFVAARFKGMKLDRITGVDFMIEILKIAADNKLSIFLLGTRREDVVKETSLKLSTTIPGLKISGYSPGLTVFEDEKGKLVYDQYDNDSIVDEVNRTKPSVLFVAFGMGKQEKWIVENLYKMTSVKVAMGVGGSFDFISGKTRRAPLLLRKIGLEWAYRLYVEPKRIGRIANATLKFIYLLFLEKLSL